MVNAPPRELAPADGRPPHPATGRMSPLAWLGVWTLAAIAVRAIGIGRDLPEFFEEALPLRWALDMRDAAGSITLRPPRFNYPSLALYLHLAAQMVADFAGRARGAWENAADYRLLFDLAPTPHVIAARLVSVLAGAATVPAVARMAERLRSGSGILAGLAALVCVPLVRASGEVYVDPVMVALAAWAMERWLAYARDGGHAWIAASILTGLATGAKYPAALLFVPGACAMLARDRVRGAGRLAMAVAIGCIMFAITTPYAFLDPQAFLADLRFEGEHASGGHLGSVGRTAAMYQFRQLVAGLGLPGALLLLAAPVLAWRARARTPALVALAGLLAFAAPVAFARIEAERYVLPVLMMAIPVAAFALVEATASLPRRAAFVAEAVFVVAMLPLGRFAFAPADDARALARRWCEANVSPRSLLITENYGPALFSEWLRDHLQRRPEFAKASPAIRDRVLAQPAWSTVTLPMEVAGRLAVRGADGEPPITAWDDLTRLGNAYYEPRLLAAADWVVTSSAVRDRYLADPQRYPEPVRTYALLDGHAKVAARFVGQHGGPTITVYRLGPEAAAALGDPSTLDPSWWTATVPASFRREGDARMVPPVPDPGSSAALPDGSPRPWVRAIAPVFAGRVRPLLEALAVELGTLGRPEPAFAYTLPALWLDPGDLGMAAIAAHASREIGLASEGRDLLERAFERSPKAPDAKVQLEYAACLAMLGERERAEQLIAPLGAAGRMALAEMVARGRPER